MLTTNRLKKGPKANVLIGPDGDRFIGLEGASVSLLAHFSSYAKQKLIVERAATLCIPNGSKKPITWIYKYMRAGEKDAEDQETFETLAFDNLVLLYTHSAFLQYQHLMDRIVGRLKGKYYDALPSVDDLKTFSAFVPPLYDYAINVLAHEMVNPWTCNYSSYVELANADQTFSDALGAAIQKLLVHRIKVGTEYYERTANRQVAWSTQYYEKAGKNGPSIKQDKKKQGKSKPNVKLPVAPDSKPQDPFALKEKKRRTRKPKTKKPTGESEGIEAIQDVSSGEAKKSNAPPATHQKKTKRSAAVCYNCNEEGHLSRDCTTEKKSKRPAPICYNCNEEGHLSRDCTVEKKVKRPLPVCYNCNVEGHLARDCTLTRKEDAGRHVAEKSTTRDTAGRNRHFRRAQRDRAAFIDVAGNGEGLRTCDREVRQGEVTRTGMIV